MPRGGLWQGLLPHFKRDLETAGRKNSVSGSNEISVYGCGVKRTTDVVCVCVWGGGDAGAGSTGELCGNGSALAGFWALGSFAQKTQEGQTEFESGHLEVLNAFLHQSIAKGEFYRRMERCAGAHDAHRPPEPPWHPGSLLSGAGRLMASSKGRCGKGRAGWGACQPPPSELHNRQAMEKQAEAPGRPAGAGRIGAPRRALPARPGARQGLGPRLQDAPRPGRAGSSVGPGEPGR